jgi:hypothetical protein
MRMKQIVLAVLVVVLLLAGGTYYYFSGRQYVYTFSESQIREKLAARLPFRRTYLLFFDVTLDNPRISLADQSGRISAGLDITIDIRIGAQPVALVGTIDVAGRLDYRSDEAAFYLADPEIENFSIQGLPEKYAGKVAKVIADGLQDYFSNHPVYALRANGSRNLAARFVLKDVVVRDHSLVVTLGL